MTSKKQIALGKRTTLISFIIGTIIFGLYFFTSSTKLLFVGYGYIVLAGVFNITILTLTFLKAQSDSENRTELLKTSRIMLVNIPILLFYIWFVLLLNNNMRITFTNTTEHKLTQINIVGCNNKHIAELAPNQSKTVWIKISGDCSIYIDYIENKEKKSEMVQAYTTQGMGQKMKHKIGTNDF